MDLVVIGGGPAGLAAVIEAAKAGTKTLVIDENIIAGGQLFKQIHKFFGSHRHHAGIRGYEIGGRLLQEAKESGAEISLNCAVCQATETKDITFVKNGKMTLLKAKKLILASGASEKVTSFPGWTLPGVMTAGAAQTMMNIHRVLPGSRCLMLGSGNVGLIVSYQILQAGGEVVGIVEALPEIGGYEVHSSKIQRAGVPILLSHTIKEVFGEDKVEGGTIVRLDKHRRPIPGSERQFDADMICLATGLKPNLALPLMVGCKTTVFPALGGRVPVHNENMETDVNGIYVAGDIAGVEEASSAIEEGRIAGVSVAERLGYLSKNEAKEMKTKIEESLDGLRCGLLGEKRKFAKQQLINMANVRHGSKTVLPPTMRSSKSTNSKEHLNITERLSAKEKDVRMPMALIECFQQIPCNACEVACPHRAIAVQNLGTPPHVNQEKCRGCGVCIPRCPGLAIFVVDPNFSRDEAVISFPYEFLPLPAKHSIVEGTDRLGRVVTKSRVLNVIGDEHSDHTAVVSIVVPRKSVHQVRGMTISRRGAGA
jgi:thioredoxin reductase/Fe-S-cluster-containing hydrogenase component 2